MWAAGDNSFGQLGVGPNISAAERPVPLSLPGGTHVAPNVLAVACGLRHSLVLLGCAAGSGLDSNGARHLDEGLQEQHLRSRSQESTQLLGFGSNRKGQLLDACASQTAAVAAAAPGGRGMRGRQDTAVFWPMQIHGLRDIGAVLQVSRSKQVLFCTCGKFVTYWSPLMLFSAEHLQLLHRIQI